MSPVAIDAGGMGSGKFPACLLHQTDPSFPWEMRRYGCRARVLMAIAEFVAGKCLNHDQINRITDMGRNTPGVIVNDKMRCGALEEHLINWSFRELHVRRIGRQVGWEPEHEYTVKWSYQIQHWETKGPDGHFVLADRDGKIIFDPHDPVEAGYPVEFKRLARKLFYQTWEAA